MKQKKVTKRALVFSALAIVVCVAMLAGTTFAWFTDSASANPSIIASGNLKVDLLIKNGPEDDYESVKTNPTKALFSGDLWKPGYTQFGYAKIANIGNLALKYQLKLIANGTPSELADAIDVYTTDSEITTRDQVAALTPIGTLAEVLADPSILATTATGHLLPGETTDAGTAIILKMRESAGNQYQNLTLDATFSLQVLATQYTYEEDSFDNQYDAGATFTDLPVAALVSADTAAFGTAIHDADPNAPTGDPDAALTFKSSDPADADLSEKDYKNWDVDFRLSFNKDVAGTEAYLYGNYGSFGWLGGAMGADMKAGQKGLVIKEWLSAVAGRDITVNYEEVVTLVQQFDCAFYYTGSETGVTATLELVMTDNDGNEHVVSTIEKPLS